MSATTVDITADIAAFAEQVRGQLADLPADAVDDLTDGLEADMAEAFADSPSQDLPEPASYALELRNAAGLPPREAPAKNGIRHSFAGVADSFRLKRDGLAANIRQSALGAGALDLLVELRPVWWVLRAWVAYELVGVIFGFEGPAFPPNFGLWVFLGLLVLISVQWGRHRWVPAKGAAGLILVGNIIAGSALLPSAQHAYDASRAEGRAEYIQQTVDEPQEGVLLNGKPVTNIFAYDADGKPMKNVQLFDQDGRPLATSVPGGNGCLQGSDCEDGGDVGAGVWVPSVLETGAKSWNVFPMQMVLAVFEDSTGVFGPDPAAKPEDRTAPFLKVPAVLQPEKVAKGND